MIQSRRINVIVVISVLLSLIVSIFLIVMGNIQKEGKDTRTEPLYATKLFGTDIISVEIIADEDEWQKMLENAMNEEFIMADVIVNGTKFEKVGIRPKGNSSLSQVAQSDSQRYSFRLQFDKYVKGQTCFGLTSFVVNNMLGDNTYMKEYISYDLMKEIGVDAPYFGFSNISVNGKEWGLYLAVELYNDSYEQRVFGDAAGMLYNVKSMDMGGNNADGDAGRMPGAVLDGAFPAAPDGGGAGSFAPDMEKNIKGEFSGEGIRFEGRQPGGMGGGRGSNGGSLEYTDDNVSNYSAIFNNVVGKGTEADYKRVVEALKALNEGRDLEKYFDVDQILRYLAAHTIVVNLDSYSSSMAQNYYIYEKDGQLTVLPWDYNLSWGGFQSGDASDVINFPIDTPVSGVEMSSRPLIERMFENEEYLNSYHEYLQELVDKYFADGRFESKINKISALIDEYVKNDATAFCTYEQYKTAVSSFNLLGRLRGESVQGQLDGAIASTASGQKENSGTIISAGELKLSDLGSMMGGRGQRSSEGSEAQDTFANGINDVQEGRGPGRQQSQDINSGFIQNRQQTGNYKYLILAGALMGVLITSILLAARLKRNY